MNARIFVDTNVLVYARDAGEIEKQKPAAEWLAFLWASRSGRLSYQVLHEFYVTVTQKLKPGMVPADARSEVRNLMTWDPIVSDQFLTGKAWDLQDRYQISWWDALIVAAAHAAFCSHLLTEDFQDGQILEGVRVLNPFLHQTSSIT